MADILDKASTGDSICSFEEVLSPLIPKGEGAKPIKQTSPGTTDLAILCGVLVGLVPAAAGLAGVGAAKVSWPAAARGRAASNVSQATSLAVGSARLGLGDVALLFIDRCKCFDLLQPEFVWALFRSVGLPEAAGHDTTRALYSEDEEAVEG